MCTEKKRCISCGEEKPLTGFARRQSSPDGYRNQCMDCRNAQHAKWCNNNRERVREIKKESHERHRVKRYEKHLEWNARNREKNRAWAKRWRENNLEYARQTYRDYYYANITKVALKNKSWIERNRDKARLNCLRRKARKAKFPDSFTKDDMATALVYWRRACPACGKEFDLINVVNWDHWVPLTDGECPGTVPWNMVPLCDGCNTSKQNKPAIDWLERTFGMNKARKIYAAVSGFLLDKLPSELKEMRRVFCVR